MGLPFVGVGWYRLDFEAPDFKQGKKATLVFDGAMSHARVFVNGHDAGSWIYGYNSFHLDVTPYLKAGEVNTLAVRLENETESSRWYPGAGLYRNVHLVINEEAHIPTWGTTVTTPEVKKEFGRVSIKTEWNMPKGKQIDAYRIETRIVDAQGNTVAQNEAKGCTLSPDRFEQSMVVKQPALWTPDTPNLYTAETRVYEGQELKDEYTTRFGFRTLVITPDKGMTLNGEPIKFRGVCNHHDLGPLGGIANVAADPPPNQHPERHGLQRHPYLAQHARPRTD